jgi:ATPase family associated with various cellular activities (AAA)
MNTEGLDYLLGRVSLVEDRIRAIVAQRRQSDPAPDDPFRGLYISEETVDRLLEGAPQHQSPTSAARRSVEQAADAAEAGGETIRVRRLALDAGLTDLDVELLLIAMVPDLDSRFERLYGYLNDDVTRRRATVSLALELAGGSAMSAPARARLLPAGALVTHALVIVEDSDRPFLTRALRVPDRVTAHLLGDGTPDAALRDVLFEPTPYETSLADDLSRAIVGGVHLTYIREGNVRTGASIAAAAFGRMARPVVAVDLTRVSAVADPAALISIAGREALLQGAGLVAGPVERLAEGSVEALRRAAEQTMPTVMFGGDTWDPLWAQETPLLVEAPTMTRDDRVQLWDRELGTPDFDASAVTAHLVLGPREVADAVLAAKATALLAGAPLTPADLRRGVRAQNAAGLERLARRIEPEVDWSDLVLAPVVVRALHEVAARARHREQVLTGWRMRRGGGRGRGITALFAGDSGTGKTMSAEVIAGELGLDLYTVNLATVVDKYVGETEKNLERIFAEAGGVNAVLFFDEADAIFGKRSEVRDAHDRYANIESAYLLQRMETFDGLAILATNLRSNIDDAFTRRLDAIVDFPAPTEDLRLRLWEKCLGPPLPLGPDLDLEFCAQSFELAGGNIRSASITAAYLAASAGSTVGMPEVISAVEQEYRKMGRLVLEREFGRYLALLR